MRRWILAALCGLLCAALFSGAALAEGAVADRPIRFRGLEWWSDADAVAEALTREAIGDEADVEKNVNCAQSLSQLPSWEFVCYGADEAFEPFQNETVTDRVGVEDGALIVAGYQVQTTCYFISDQLEDVPGGLYMAEYEVAFETSQVQRVYDDLLEKLTSVYGEPSSVPEPKAWVKRQSLTFETRSAIWTDADGNRVALCWDVEQEHELAYIRIVYGAADGDARLMEACRASAGYPELSGDMGGL